MSSDRAILAPIDLEQLRAHCEQITRTYARNFYYGLQLLPAAKRNRHVRALRLDAPGG